MLKEGEAGAKEHDWSYCVPQQLVSRAASCLMMEYQFEALFTSIWDHLFIRRVSSLSGVWRQFYLIPCDSLDLTQLYETF